jgi:hypothetical protein
MPFAGVAGLYDLVIHHLKCSKVNKLQEESGLVFSSGVKQGIEDDLEAHLLAWAQCNFIPMFTYRNKKAFEGCNFRPDIVWTLPDLNVILECNKYAHENYNKESEYERTQELINAPSRNGLNQVVFIRFNPSLPGSTSQFKFATLLSVLIGVFVKTQEYVATDRSVIYLFYPEKVSVWYPAFVFKPVNIVQQDTQ